MSIPIFIAFIANGISLIPFAMPHEYDLHRWEKKQLMIVLFYFMTNLLSAYAGVCLILF